MPDDQNQPLATPLVLHDAPLRQSDPAYFHFDEFAKRGQSREPADCVPGRVARELRRAKIE